MQYNLSKIKDMCYISVDKTHPEAMQLISIGWVKGTQAAQLKAGDLIMWNYGSIYQVHEVRAERGRVHCISSPIGDKCRYEQKFLPHRKLCILTQQPNKP